MATTSHTPPEPRPAPQPQPAPADPATDTEQRERTDKEIAERISTPPETPTPTQEEADAIKLGEYDASAPAGQRVKAEPKKRAMAGERGPGYATR